MSIIIPETQDLVCSCIKMNGEYNVIYISTESNLAQKNTSVAVEAAMYPTEYSETNNKSRPLKVHVNCSQTEYLSSIQLQVNLSQEGIYSVKNSTVPCNSQKEIFTTVNCGIPYNLKLFWISSSPISLRKECLFQEIEDELNCPIPTGISHDCNTVTVNRAVAHQ